MLDQTSTIDNAHDYQYVPPKRYGWVCPVCNRTNNPNTMYCPCNREDRWQFPGWRHPWRPWPTITWIGGDPAAAN